MHMYNKNLIKHQLENVKFKANSAWRVPELSQGQTVWIPDHKENVEVVDKHMTPRSYIVKTPPNTVHRNCRHLIPSSSPVKGSRD